MRRSGLAALLISALGACSFAPSKSPFTVDVRASSKECYVYLAGHIVDQAELSSAAQSAKHNYPAVISVDKSGKHQPCITRVALTLREAGFNAVLIGNSSL